MSATEELRRLLDERGVEHEDDEDVTRFFGPDGFEVVMQEDIDGKLDCLTSLYLTPEQAIATTLGTGVCHMEYCLELSNDELYPTEAYECSVCGSVTVEGKPNFCPNCGAKVVDG